MNKKANDIFQIIYLARLEQNNYPACRPHVAFSVIELFLYFLQILLQF
jgi:hypothetical protein